jgi:hypothetical protein
MAQQGIHRQAGGAKKPVDHFQNRWPHLPAGRLHPTAHLSAEDLLCLEGHLFLEGPLRLESHICLVRHLRPERHQRHHVTLAEMNVMKSKVCHPGVCIHIFHFQTLDFSIIMHMQRIASTIQIIFQIIEYTICCVEIPWTLILKTTAAGGVNLRVTTSID